MSEHLNLGNPPIIGPMNPPSVLLKQAWSIYETNFKKIFLMCLIPILSIVPTVLVFIGYSLLNPINGQVNNTPLIINALLIVLGVVAMLFSLYVGASAQLGFMELLKNLNLSIKEAFNAGRKLFLPSLVIMLATLGLLILWALLFIFPAFIFSLYYGFGVYVLVYEGITGRAAIKRSKELVKHHWWSVFGRFLCMELVVFIPMFIMGLASSMFVFITGPNSWFIQLWSVLTMVVMFLITPFVGVYMILIYKDLVRIKNNQANQLN